MSDPSRKIGLLGRTTRKESQGPRRSQSDKSQRDTESQPNRSSVSSRAGGNRIVNRLGQQPQSGGAKLTIVCIAGDNLVIVGHALDDQRFQQLVEAELNFVEGVGVPELDDLFVGGGFFTDLLAEQAVFVGEIGPEALVKNFDDFGQWDPLVLRLAGADVGRAFHARGVPFAQRDHTRKNPFETVALQSDLIPELHTFGVPVEREMRQHESPEAIEHLQVSIAVRHDLAHEGVAVHVAVQLLAELAALRFVRHRLEAIDRRLTVELHPSMVLRAWSGHGLVADAPAEADDMGVGFSGRGLESV